MKFTRFRYDSNLLIAAVAVSVVCHIALVIVWGGMKHQLQEPQRTVGTVITAQLMREGTLAVATKDVPAEMGAVQAKTLIDAHEVGSAGGSKSSRGSPWRRSSAAIEAPYGLIPTQAMHAQRHKEQLYLAERLRGQGALNVFLQQLSSLQVVGDCQITLMPSLPAVVMCDVESDLILITDLAFKLTQPLGIDRAIQIEKSPNKPIRFE